MHGINPSYTAPGTAVRGANPPPQAERIGFIPGPAYAQTPSAPWTPWTPTPQPAGIVVTSRLPSGFKEAVAARLQGCEIRLILDASKRLKGDEELAKDVLAKLVPLACAADANGADLYVVNANKVACQKLRQGDTYEAFIDNLHASGDAKVGTALEQAVGDFFARGEYRRKRGLFITLCAGELDDMSTYTDTVKGTIKKFQDIEAESGHGLLNRARFGVLPLDLRDADLQKQLRKIDIKGDKSFFRGPKKPGEVSVGDMVEVLFGRDFPACDRPWILAAAMVTQGFDGTQSADRMVASLTEKLGLIGHAPLRGVSEPVTSPV